VPGLEGGGVRSDDEQSRHSQLVRVGGTDFFVEVSGADGPETIGVAQAMSFDGVRRTIEAIADELAMAWTKVRPSEATVEFGLAIKAKSGKLTGLLVGADGEASLKVTLTWKAHTDSG
jgi:hypothetical protein